jgi:hypothetical protein
MISLSIKENEKYDGMVMKHNILLALFKTCKSDTNTTTINFAVRKILLTLIKQNEKIIF